MDKMNSLRSSLAGDTLRLDILGIRGFISGVPRWVEDSFLLVEYLRRDDSAVVFSDTCTCPGSCGPSFLPDGDYNIHLGGKRDGRFFYPIHPGKGFPIKVEGGRALLISPQPFAGNRDVFLSITKEFITKYSHPAVPSRKAIAKDVCNLSAQIVKGCFTQYDKVLAVHDWVSGHIYYDYDSLLDGSYLKSDVRPASVLKSRRTVCQGYSALAAALLNAAGIRSVIMTCYALGLGTDDDWGDPATMTAKANHAINCAYADGRWVFFDTAWDSKQSYRNGRFEQGPTERFSRKHFDPTLAFLSYTHRLIGPLEKI